MLMVKVALFLLLFSLLLTSAVYFNRVGSFGAYQISFCFLILLIMMLSFTEFRMKHNWLRAIFFITKAFGYFALLIVAKEIVSNPALAFSQAFSRNAVVVIDVFWWLIAASMFGQVVNRFLFFYIEAISEVKIPSILTGLFYFLLYGGVVLGILAFEFKYEITALLAASGILTIIVGLAIRANLSNVFSGLFLMMDRPFRQGDFITMGEHEGVVETISWRTTIMTTASNQKMVVPNELVAQSTIVNHSHADDEDQSLSNYYKFIYTHPDHDPVAVRQLMLDAILKTRPVGERVNFNVYTVQLMELTEKGMMFRIGFDSTREDMINNCSNVLMNVHAILFQAGIRVAPGMMRYELEVESGLSAIGGLKSTKENYQDLGEVQLNEYTEGLKDSVILSNIPLFRKFSPASIEVLTEHSRRLTFTDSEAVVTRGDSGDSMFIIIHGVVRVMIASDGKELQVALLGLHDHFGEMSLLTGEPRSASVLAVGRVVVLEVEKTAMKAVLNQFPEVLESLAGVISRRQVANDEAEKNKNNKVHRSRTLGVKLVLQMKRFFGLN